MNDFILDYSQYKDWQFCPWYWYEKHVNKVEKINPYQRNDPLALGSLVHAGLETWHGTKRPEIPEAAIIKSSPTPETLGLAQAIIVEYAQRYPTEPWEAAFIEKPLLRDYQWGKLLAKLDAWTKIDEPMQVPDGVNGGMFYLNPGIYGIENKTKKASIKIGKYRQWWLVNMQATFQYLALQAHYENVQGIIVNVIEKPDPYVPRATCKECGEINELAMWVPNGEPGVYSCPNCGSGRKITPKGPKAERKIGFWRMLVQRTPEELLRGVIEIEQVARGMKMMVASGVGETIPANRENCIQPSSGYRECQFFAPHTYGFITIGHPEYKKVEEYMGI